MAGVKIADTLSRFGSGKYPLVIATDINLSDGTNLQEYLDDLLLKIVQADWEQSDTTAIDYIKNKPIIPVLTDLIDDETESDETTYSSNKIKALINAIEAGIKFEIVEELPSEDIDTHTIYLVPREEENDNNGYDEYLYINDKWELIGSTYIDLSNYYTKSQVDALLDNKVDKVSGKGLSTNDFTDADKTKLDSAITSIPIASTTDLGVIKVGSNLSIDGNGVLSADVPSPSGDSELSKDITANLNVGAIASGTTLNQGTTFTEFVEKLVVTEIVPTISFSISKSGNVVYGSSYTEKLTISVTNMGTAKSIDTIEWYENNTLVHTDTIASSITGSWDYTMANTTTDSTTFKAIVKYKKSNDSQVSVTKTASISFYYNKFYGIVDSLTPSEVSVEALSTALGTSKGGTYSFSANSQRIAYAYPKSLGALTSIKDGNGFSLFDSFTRTEQTYTQNSTSVDYYLYVLTDATTVSGYSVTFA